MVTENESPGLRIEVAHARPGKQVLLTLTVKPGTSLLDAIEQSGIRDEFPDIRIEPDKLGIFGRRVGPDYELKNGDRIEIYRPLIADPKEIRRERARQAGS